MPHSDYYDPVYREEILRSPAGRGLFFAPDGVKRVRNTIDAILNSEELKRLHFVYEDPFCIRGFPSANYTAYQQLAGTLYLSDLCRPKVEVDGIMFYQWLLEKNLLEEYMIALLIDRMIRLPFDHVLRSNPSFEDFPKWAIVRDLLDNSGDYYEAWKRRFGGNGKTNALETIKAHLLGAFDSEIVVDVLKRKEEMSYERRVLKAFVCGPLNLARIDKVYRLAYATGKNYDILNVGSLFQHIVMSLGENGNVKYDFGVDDTLRQMFRFYSTYFEIILPEITLHESASFYRALFSKSLSGFFEKIKKEPALMFDLIFLSDYELCYKLKQSGCPYLDRIFYGSQYKFYYRKEVVSDFAQLDAKLASLLKMVSTVKLKEDDVVVDVVRSSYIDKMWLSPESFPDMKRVASEKRLKNIKRMKEKSYLSFFSLNDVNNNDFRNMIDDVFNS